MNEGHDTGPVIRRGAGEAPPRGDPHGGHVSGMKSRETTARYQQSRVLNAGREQLLLTVYDGLLRFLARAERGIVERNYDEKCLGVSRAQTILLELQRTLDPTAAPELAANLSRIYAHLIEELALADICDEPGRVRDVAHAVMELRTAWAEAVRQCGPSPTGGASQGQTQ